ncbi:hypothetical protein G7B40_024020 [Aetokthonos hydrillicola Thurmond2011]|uniref:Uncharacterized protein n=1 Tax=Aetokthonos hydrillicola Thurmond2011 TaxID=2712845 RepID=A0AAP5I9X8_9CYAN|nr:hypothetical protein [Aetokthonos hydrillicola]MBW4586915.1 hypothetical protein [Aetokthonos hydrillicola CCALA 1050]MDR9897610.1 hypothetical protein [Aetokthonos hydrillicola Thurmond2011]
MATASVIISFKDDLKPPFPNGLSFTILTPLLYTVTAGIIAGALTWLVIRLWPRSR